MAAPRKPKTAPEQDVTDDGLCPEHYPHGWSHVEEQFAGVGCEHGTWTRDAEQQQDDETDETAGD